MNHRTRALASAQDILVQTTPDVQMRAQMRTGLIFALCAGTDLASPDFIEDVITVADRIYDVANELASRL